jgi:hypothetical protein
VVLAVVVQLILSLQPHSIAATVKFQRLVLAVDNFTLTSFHYCDSQVLFNGVGCSGAVNNNFRPTSFHRGISQVLALGVGC